MKKINENEIIFTIEETIKNIFSNRTKSPDGEYIFVESPYNLAKDIYKSIEFHIDKIYETGYYDGYDDGLSDGGDC